MDYFQEIIIRARDEDATGLVETLKDMCGTLERRYRFQTQESAWYGEQIGVVGCMLSRVDVGSLPRFAWAAGNGNSLYLANIVPRGEDMNSEMYNNLATEFMLDLKAFSRRKHLGVTIQSSGHGPLLEAIIPGAKCRSFFETFLGVYPRSYHPNDIERLDVFICALSRYGRGKIDLGMLQSYLVNMLKWSEADAEWCCNRISIGLTVLRMHRRF
jgi:hypothetical protein